MASPLSVTEETKEIADKACNYWSRIEGYGMVVKFWKYKRLCRTNRFSNCPILAFVCTDSS